MKYFLFFVAICGLSAITNEELSQIFDNCNMQMTQEQGKEIAYSKQIPLPFSLIYKENNVFTFFSSDKTAKSLHFLEMKHSMCIVALDGEGYAHFFLMIESNDAYRKQINMLKCGKTNGIPNKIKQYMRDEITISREHNSIAPLRTPIVFTYSHKSLLSKIKRLLFACCYFWKTNDIKERFNELSLFYKNNYLYYVVNSYEINCIEKTVNIKIWTNLWKN
jgi:hypothetical protein